MIFTTTKNYIWPQGQPLQTKFLGMFMTITLNREDDLEQWRRGEHSGCCVFSAM